MDERIVKLDGIELAIAEAGRGQRPFLLLHGFTGAKEDFTPCLDRLAEAGYHAVAPDLRGHGTSGKPASESAYSFEVLADDALRLVDSLGWDRFVLLGHSMGGMVAQFIARQAHARLTGLILMDTGHGPIRGLDPAMVQAAVSIVRAKGIDALADILTERQSPLETPSHRRLLDTQPGYAEFGARKFRSTSPALYAAMSPTFASTEDRLSDLEALPSSLPVLVIVGEEDVPFIEASRRMAATLKGSSLVIIPNAGHSPQFENPDAWWLAVSSFLARIPRRHSGGSTDSSTAEFST
jgi:pimeloyl-ACP methyl ester carboxylesterase